VGPTTVDDGVRRPEATDCMPRAIVTTLTLETTTFHSEVVPPIATGEKRPNPMDAPVSETAP